MSLGLGAVRPTDGFQEIVSVFPLGRNEVPRSCTVVDTLGFSVAPSMVTTDKPLSRTSAPLPAETVTGVASSMDVALKVNVI